MTERSWISKNPAGFWELSWCGKPPYKFTGVELQDIKIQADSHEQNQHWIYSGVQLRSIRNMVWQEEKEGEKEMETNKQTNKANLKIEDFPRW